MGSLFTSESVTEGHPDKIADQISDAILDATLKQDKNARVACEVLVNTGLVVVSGEISTSAYVDIPAVTRKTITNIGYNHGELLFDGRSCAIMNCIDEQSPDIAQGVDREDKKLGAGDQGLMFGYACNQTSSFMPLPIEISHQLTQRLAFVRKNNIISYLEPDGKAQVTFHMKNGKPTFLHTVVVSTQHKPNTDQEMLKKDIFTHVIWPICEKYLTEETVLHINPTGKFEIGGPHGDCGLTGRKIMVDTYGGWAKHGGGAFSGKDPSKVDRSGAYMARFIAKNLVANQLCTECEVQLAYAIGIPEPVSININPFGTETKPISTLQKIVQKNFKLSPRGIITQLDLLRPIYKNTAAYGHFGRKMGGLFTWEQIIELK